MAVGIGVTRAAPPGRDDEGNDRRDGQDRAALARLRRGDAGQPGEGRERDQPVDNFGPRREPSIDRRRDARRAPRPVATSSGPRPAGVANAAVAPTPSAATAAPRSRRMVAASADDATPTPTTDGALCDVVTGHGDPDDAGQRDQARAA